MVVAASVSGFRLEKALIEYKGFERTGWCVTWLFSWPRLTDGSEGSDLPQLLASSCPQAP